MANCECLEGCSFFNDKMAKIPTLAEVIKNDYCREDGSKCARYQVFKVLGKAKVPRDLYPTELEKVQSIISEG